MSNQARRSVEPIVQNCTRPANVFSFLWIACCFFSLGCSKGSGTQNSREIWTPSCFMQITARFCQHSRQTQQWMPIKQSELGRNEDCVGLRARAAPAREWYFFTLSIEWRRTSNNDLYGAGEYEICSEKPVGGCHYKRAWIESLWFIQIVHSEGVGEKREEMKEERNRARGEKTRRWFLVERRAGELRGGFQTFSCSGLTWGCRRVMPGWDRRVGRMRRGSWDRIWCLN